MMWEKEIILRKKQIMQPQKIGSFFGELWSHSLGYVHMKVDICLMHS